MKLAKYAEMSICVDNISNVNELNDVAKQMNLIVGSVVEVDVGQERLHFKTVLQF